MYAYVPESVTRPRQTKVRRTTGNNYSIMAQAKKAVAKNSTKQTSRTAARAAVKTYQNYINGEWVASESGEMFENINPADTRDVVGRFPLSTKEDIYAAVNAAQGALIVGEIHRRQNAQNYSSI